MRAFLIGGTRNLGPALVDALVADGWRVSVFHRGQTRCALPSGVEELFGDRGDAGQLRAAVNGRSFDAVFDTTLYNGADAKAAARIFAGLAGRYIMIGTGQVYLVRDPAPARPFPEPAYEGPVMPPPPASADLEDWQYGIGKRDAEEALRGLPVAVLRLPMVNSARDHHQRLRNYVARLQDGGPILAPSAPRLPLRHVYGPDVVRAALAVCRTGFKGACNISQDQTVTLEEFLAMLADIMGVPAPPVVYRPREILDAAEVLPHCSPFSGPWMSALDNTRSKAELGMVYTPLREYLRALALPVDAASLPGYRRRSEEMALARG